MADISISTVQAARAGEPDAWDALFRRYQLPLFAYVRELVHDEQASLDIVQESFIRAVRHLDSLRDDARFGSWLFGIAHQQCAQRWRRPPREEPRDEPVGDAEPDDGFNPAEWLVRREQEELFMNALRQLSPAHRAVLVLHFLEDFPLDQIAAITGANVGTVKSRLHYAKRELRQRLEEP